MQNFYYPDYSTHTKESIRPENVLKKSPQPQHMAAVCSKHCIHSDIFNNYVKYLYASLSFPKISLVFSLDGRNVYHMYVINSYIKVVFSFIGKIARFTVRYFMS